MQQPRLVILLTALLALTACADGGRTPKPPPAGAGPLMGLPIPDSLPLLPPDRRAAFTEADLRRDGAAIEAGLPSSRFSPGGVSGTFAPIYGSSGGGLEDMAFAIYSFKVQGFDRDPNLYLSWVSPPQPGSFYLGLADFGAQRWSFSQPQGATLSLLNLAPYTAPDDSLFVALIFTGDADSVLGSLRLGEPFPIAALQGGPLSGAEPLAVDFDASGSSAPDSAITSFEWDYDGDGTYDESTGAVPAVQHIYPDPGTYDATVRVTNGFGHTASASVELTVNPSGPPQAWEHSLGKGAMEQFFALAKDSSGNLYAVGQTDDPTRMILVSKWSDAGGLLWAKTYDLTDHGTSLAFDVAVDTQDNAIVCGFGLLGGASGIDAIVQKFAPDGSLVWSKAYGGSSTQFAYTLCLDGDDIYAAGQIEGKDALTFRLNPDGSVNWARQYREENYRPWDCALLNTGSGNSALYVLVSSEHIPVSDACQPLLLRYGLGGGLEADDLMDTGTDSFDPRGLGLSYDGGSGLATIYIAGNYNLSAPQYTAIAAVKSDRTPLYERFFTSAAGNHANALLLDQNSLTVVGNYVDDASGDTWAAVFSLVASDGSYNALDTWADPGGAAAFEDVILGQSGLVFCGTGTAAPGSWGNAASISAAASHTWIDNDGSEFAVLSFPVEDTAGTLADWTGYALDSGGGSTDGLLIREL